MILMELWSGEVLLLQFDNYKFFSHFVFGLNVKTNNTSHAFFRMIDVYSTYVYVII